MPVTSKLTTRDDRDRAIKAGLEEFANKTAKKIAVDKQARFACKGGNKFWQGYKEQASVARQSGLINKVAATSAAITDAGGVAHACSGGGAAFGDKG